MRPDRRRTARLCQLARGGASGSRLASVLVAAAVAASAKPASAESCWQTFVCRGQATTPGERARCEERSIPGVMGQVLALDRCAEAFCPSRGRGCLEERCGAELAACPRQVPAGTYAAGGSVSAGGLRGTFGGGYDFTAGVPILQLGLGYEHLWLLGSGSRAHGVAFGGDFEADVAFTTETTGGMTSDVLVPVLWGNLSARYYTPMAIDRGLPTWTFGVGARVGAGVVALETPFVAVLPGISVRMVNLFNVELELWGGPAFSFGEPTEVLWLLGADLKLGFLWRFGG